MAKSLRLELDSNEALGIANALAYFALAISADECQTLAGVDQSVIAEVHARVLRLCDAGPGADDNG